MNEQHLLYLEVQARELMSACQAIETLFSDEADLLSREADARRLQTFAVSFAKHLEEEEWHETLERLRSNEDQLSDEKDEFVAGTIGFILKGSNGMKAAKNEMQTIHAGRKHYLGMIVVGVGAGGLPDDVTIVPVSRLARAQNREETEIIRELQQQGGLLFYPDTFRRMIGILIDYGRAGKLRLPISLKQLPTKWAIPGKVTVGFSVSVQAPATVSYQVMVVPQLPPGKDTSTQI